MNDLLSTVTDSNEVKFVSTKEVTDTLSRLSNNKAADSNGLRSEHFKYAGELFHSFFAMCYNLMLTHSYIPVAATQTVICPTIKDNKSSATAEDGRPTLFTSALRRIFTNR